MKIYVAGPMTGLPEFNYPAFNAAEAALRDAGFDPVNPARREVQDGWEWIDYMRPALVDVSECDGIATLPDWGKSRGATLEVHVATTLGLPVLPLAEWLAIKAQSPPCQDVSMAGRRRKAD